MKTETSIVKIVEISGRPFNTSNSFKKMSNFPKKWCQRIFNKMLDMNITKLVSQEISNRKDNLALNFDSIKDKLADNQYKSTKEWINEVNSLLLNEQRFNDKNTHYSHIVQYLQKWFNKKVKNVPLTELDAWMVDYHNIQRHMKKLANMNPPS